MKSTWIHTDQPTKVNEYNPLFPTAIRQKYHHPLHFQWNLFWVRLILSINSESLLSSAYVNCLSLFLSLHLPPFPSYHLVDWSITIVLAYFMSFICITKFVADNVCFALWFLLLLYSEVPSHSKIIYIFVCGSLQYFMVSLFMLKSLIQLQYILFTV